MGTTVTPDIDEVGVAELTDATEAPDVEAEERLAPEREPVGGARTPSIDMTPEAND